MKVIKVNKKDIVVNYTINSLIAMEVGMGKPFTQLFNEEDGISLADLRSIIYYGLTNHQKDITLAEVGDIISNMIEEGKSLIEISELFMGELSKALGLQKAIEEALVADPKK